LLIRKVLYERVKAVIHDDSEPSHDELLAIFARGIESSDWNDPGRVALNARTVLSGYFS
jgi:hypothetical protein